MEKESFVHAKLKHYRFAQVSVEKDLLKEITTPPKSSSNGFQLKKIPPSKEITTPPKSSSDGFQLKKIT